MSVERRLAAKERSRKARTRAIRNRILKVAGILAAIAILAGLVLLILDATIDIFPLNYSKYLSEDNKFEGKSAKEYLSELPNPDEFKPKEIDISDADVNSAAASSIKSILDKQSETEQEEKTEAEYLALLTDEWVAKNAAEDLGDKYPHTKEGFLQSSRDMLLNLYTLIYKGEVTSQYAKEVTVKKYPTKFVKQYMKILEDMNPDAAGQYASRSQYEEQLKSTAETHVKQYLILIALYEDFGFSETNGDLIEWYAEEYDASDKTVEEKRAMWEKACDDYGKPWLLLQYRSEMAENELRKRVYGEE